MQKSNPIKINSLMFIRQISLQLELAHIWLNTMEKLKFL